ncbi:hypothetical protein C9374_003547 [Naegleria lovaniensis]|uniref:N-acetylaspartylglutamate synthase n=1 Tax=Naegleria lovaniensis TaxID=51637 RepID=A0AA88GZB2_NAELO|nr:uncharacterized protein C9374_003547 [Naegleria lovaniensis]KAG2393783.1 hypothetical protein C9374_003547 [Naegleria lovaniensis]
MSASIYQHYTEALAARKTSSSTQEEEQTSILVPRNFILHNLQPSLIGEKEIVFYNAQDPTFYQMNLENPQFTIWLLCREVKYLYSQKRLFECAWHANIQLKLMEIGRFEFVVLKGCSKLLYDGVPVEIPQVVIPRLGAKINYYGLAVLRFLEGLSANKPLILNNSSSIEVSRDKFFTMQRLAAKNIPVPRTIVAKFPLDVQKIEENFTFPLILKKVSGSQGNGVLLIQDQGQLVDIAELVDPSNPLLIQEFIKDSSGKDIRVIVVGGRAIGAMKRIATKGFKSNFHQGGKVEQVPLTQELELLAVECALACGLDVAGVDILFDGDNSYKICEVNSSPGFEGFEMATGVDVAKEIIMYCKNNCSPLLNV